MNVTQNRRRTQISQDLKEGLLPLRGHGLGMKSLTRTRKPYLSFPHNDSNSVFYLPFNSLHIEILDFVTFFIEYFEKRSK